MYSLNYDIFQTIGEYLDREEEYLEQPPLKVHQRDDVAPVCYDAMWSFALALNKTIAGIIIMIYMQHN